MVADIDIRDLQVERVGLRSNQIRVLHLSTGTLVVAPSKQEAMQKMWSLVFKQLFPRIK